MDTPDQTVTSSHSPASSASTVQANGGEWPLNQSLNADWRARSVSAPASRSSSFAKNLDQLAALNQSAHRFPANIDATSSSRSSSPKLHAAGRQSLSREGSHRSRSRTSSSGSSTHRSTLVTRSTPASPHLSPCLPTDHHLAIAREGITGRVSGSRARSALFSSGAGFTPAFSSAFPLSGVPPDPSPSSRPALSTGRSRSTSASDALAMTGNRIGTANRQQTPSNSLADSGPTCRTTSTPHPQRARSHSARSSPILLTAFSTTPSYAEGAFEDDAEHGSRPQRTHSVPQLTHISPLIYGYPYHCDPYSGAPLLPTPGDYSVAGYFALPPSVSVAADPPSISPGEVDELPPPYTPDEVAEPISRPQSTRSERRRPSQQQRASSSHRTSFHAPEEGNSDDISVLSFQAGRSRVQRTQPTRQIVTPNGGAVGQPSAEDNIRSDTDADSQLASPHIRADSSSTSPLARARAPESTSMAQEEARYLERLERPSKLRRFVLKYLAQPLRLLAIVPGVVGTFWLLRNAVMVAYTQKAILKTHESRPSSMEFALSALWSAMTAYHALSLTTLLSRRWLHYYSLLPSLIRLLALQALCWPLVRLTLFVFGPRNPLPAWTLISVTTALSDTVARWLVSNITDESDMVLQNSVLAEYAGQTSSTRRGRSRRPGRTIAMSFWRAVVGAPPRQRSGRVSASMTTAERGGALAGLRIAHAIESEADSDTDVISARSARRDAVGQTTAASSLRRRRLRNLQRDASPLSGHGYGSEVTSGGEGEERTDGNTWQAGKIERVGRIFHWDMAIRRNVVPIGALSYMTMWIILMEDVRKRWIV